MVQIPLGLGAYSRPYGKLPEIQMQNRFFERSPLGEAYPALLSRPGTSLFLRHGVGPIRALYTQPGVFGGDLFFVSGQTLCRFDGEVVTEIAGVVAGAELPVMTSVSVPAAPGQVNRALLFITDGHTLQYYEGEVAGAHALAPCSVPENVPIVDLATLASYVICVEGRSQRFFWIRPGETDIDPLDFSSAESEPDEIVNILTVGDQFWVFGQTSTESWYASGDADQPFYRSQGRAFSQGILPGTVARVQEALVVVGQDRVAYRIAGMPERISHHGIEEAFRRWQEQVRTRPTP